MINVNHSIGNAELVIENKNSNNYILGSLSFTSLGGVLAEGVKMCCQIKV
jgi:hypothetical protein